MQITVSNEGEYTLVKVGEPRLDAANSRHLRQEVMNLVGTGSTRIILDISAVQFMDSSGLGSMVSILKTIGGKGDLVISGAKGIVADLFKLTRMDRVFCMTPDVSVAVQLMAMA